MAHIGRPRALGDVQRREVCALLSVGCGVRTAAEYVGCSPSTIRREALRNPDFSQQVRQSELQCQLSPLQTIQKAAATNWKAAAWLLERTNADRFGRRAKDPKAETSEAAGQMIDELFQALAHEIKDARLCDRLGIVVRTIVGKWQRDLWAETHHRRDPVRAKRLLDEFEKRQSPPAFEPDSVFDQPEAKDEDFDDIGWENDDPSGGPDPSPDRPRRQEDLHQGETATNRDSNAEPPVASGNPDTAHASVGATLDAGWDNDDFDADDPTGNDDQLPPYREIDIDLKRQLDQDDWPGQPSPAHPVGQGGPDPSPDRPRRQEALHQGKPSTNRNPNAKPPVARGNPDTAAASVGATHPPSPVHIFTSSPAHPARQGGPDQSPDRRRRQEALHKGEPVTNRDPNAEPPVASGNPDTAHASVGATQPKQNKRTTAQNPPGKIAANMQDPREKPTPPNKLPPTDPGLLQF